MTDVTFPMPALSAGEECLDFSRRK